MENQKRTKKKKKKLQGRYKTVVCDPKRTVVKEEKERSEMFYAIAGPGNDTSKALSDGNPPENEKTNSFPQQVVKVSYLFREQIP